MPAANNDGSYLEVGIINFEEFKPGIDFRQAYFARLTSQNEIIQIFIVRSPKG